MSGVALIIIIIIIIIIYIKVIRIFRMFVEVHERDYFLKYFLFKNILK